MRTHNEMASYGKSVSPLTRREESATIMAAAIHKELKDAKQSRSVCGLYPRRGRESGKLQIADTDRKADRAKAALAKRWDTVTCQHCLRLKGADAKAPKAKATKKATKAKAA